MEVSSGPLKILVDLYGRSGLRPAEARGLRWEFVDLENHTLKVVTQMSELDTFVQPKTKRSLRVIRIDGETIDRLASWQTRQEMLLANLEVLWHNFDLVITPRTGRPINRNNAIRSLKSACKQAGSDPAISPYELRHTAITIQANAGHNAWQIADWAGTSERMICDVYRHQLTEVAELLPLA